MAHKDYNSLKKAVFNEAKKSMNLKVAPVIKREMSKNVHSEVYEKYNPIEYHSRRKDAGGLSSVENMKVYFDMNVDSFDMRVRNETKAVSSSILLTPLIEEGDSWAMNNGYGLYHDRIATYARMLQYNSEPFTPYYKPRRFIRKTKEYVKGNKKRLVSIIEKDMNG